MKVRDIMTKDVTSVQTTDPIANAACIMRDYDVGAVPVFEGDHERGIITDRDLAVRCIADNVDCNNEKVGAVMSRDVKECMEDDDINTAAQLMEQYKVRRLLVRDDKGKITGVVSLGDLATRGDKLLSEEILEKVSEHVHA